jgi:excinuclease ABC subunit C
MTTEDFKKLAPSIPKLPGVYRFLDEDDVILYVGKAKSLRTRLSNYFGSRKNMAYKTITMVKHAHHIEYTIVETEHDALLLEATLVKANQPRYNVMLKDGKSYVHICIKNERFPRVFFTRRVIKDGSTYFGPYTSKYRANIILETIKKIFELRTCTLNLSADNIDKGKFKVCLEYHIKNCKGPCEGHESEEEYDDKIKQVKNILKGNFRQVKDYMNEQMDLHVKNLQFEKAQRIKENLSVLQNYQSSSMVVSTKIKDVDIFHMEDDNDYAYVNYLKVVNGALLNTDILEMKKNLNENKDELLAYGIDRLREKFNSIAPEIILDRKIDLIEKDLKIIVPQKGEKKHLLDLAAKNMKYFLLQKRKEAINKIKKLTASERILGTMKSDLDMDVMPFHIECFDNSNIQGTNPVSSCVVFKNAKPSKKDYRKYNIKTVVGPDDFASMQEVVTRRYTRLIKEESPLPQLVIIDGGKGQLSAAYDIFKELGIEEKVALIGIAKRLEEIYFPDDPVPLYINKKSESLKLIQQLRNEAHRFAINFHRDQRSKNFLGTELTRIVGVGEKTADKLLSHFGSVKRIKEASEVQLAEVVGVRAAKLVFSYFLGAAPAKGK